MHPNLEKRFVELEVARTSLEIKRLAFASRFQYLFENLANDMGISHEDLANRLGWNPYPPGGNAISLGKADPSPEDCYRLLDVYLGFTDTLPKDNDPHPELLSDASPPFLGDANAAFYDGELK